MPESGARWFSACRAFRGLQVLGKRQSGRPRQLGFAGNHTGRFNALRHVAGLDSRRQGYEIVCLRYAEAATAMEHSRDREQAD